MLATFCAYCMIGELVLWRLQGLYQDRPKLPFVPGSEVSGVVVEVGRDVRTVAVGDSVRMPLFFGRGLVGQGVKCGCGTSLRKQCVTYKSKTRQGAIQAKTSLDQGACSGDLLSPPWLLQAFAASVSCQM